MIAIHGQPALEAGTIGKALTLTADGTQAMKPKDTGQCQGTLNGLNMNTANPEAGILFLLPQQCQTLTGVMALAERK
jgi:hypothetical protein